MFDVIASLVMLAMLPVLVFIVKKPLGFIRNIFYVLIGKRSWVGYETTQSIPEMRLPEIRKGVLHPNDVLKKQVLSPDDISRLNILYARNYKVINDFRILLKGFRELGR